MSHQRCSVIILIFLLIFGSCFLFILLHRPLNNGSREQGIIEHLLSLGYTFQLPREYFSNKTLYSKTALLIHDGDFVLGGVSTFIRIELGYSVKSCFLPRMDTDWFQENIGVFQDAERQGWEIGIQYDTFNSSKFVSQVAYARSLFADVSTTTYHDIYFPLYNETLWSELGLHEIYALNFSYYTDTNDVLNSPSVLTDLVVVQLHTDWTA